MLSTLLKASPLLAGGIFIAANWGHSDNFSRQIDQPPGVVRSALQGIDVRKLPHTLAKLEGADRTRLPRIRLDADQAGYNWTVTSDGKILMRLRAEIEPVDGGTRVSTSVEDGDTDDAPAVAELFKSRSEMAPLFAVAVERALGAYIPSSERSLYSVQDHPYGYVEPEVQQMSSSDYSGNRGVRIEPGKPMIDVRRR